MLAYDARICEGDYSEKANPQRKLLSLGEKRGESTRTLVGRWSSLGREKVELADTDRTQLQRYSEGSYPW